MLWYCQNLFRGAGFSFFFYIPRSVWKLKNLPFWTILNFQPLDYYWANYALCFRYPMHSFNIYIFNLDCSNIYILCLCYSYKPFREDPGIYWSNYRSPGGSCAPLGLHRHPHDPPWKEEGRSPPQAPSSWNKAWGHHQHEGTQDVHSYHQQRLGEAQTLRSHARRRIRGLWELLSLPRTIQTIVLE